jgi:hypothetical protein
MMGFSKLRSPAKAGVQRHRLNDWAPAFAGEREGSEL